MHDSVSKTKFGEGFPEYVNPALLTLVAKHAPTELEVFEKLLSNVGAKTGYTDKFLNSNGSPKLIKIKSPTRQRQCFETISLPRSRPDSSCSSARQFTGKKSISPRPKSAPVPRTSSLSPGKSPDTTAAKNTRRTPKARVPEQTSRRNHPLPPRPKSPVLRAGCSRLKLQSEAETEKLSISNECTSPAGGTVSPAPSIPKRKFQAGGLSWEVQLKASSSSKTSKEPSSGRTSRLSQQKQRVKQFDAKWRAIMLEKKPVNSKTKWKPPPWDFDIAIPSYEGVGPWFGSPTSKQQEMDIPLRISNMDVDRTLEDYTPKRDKGRNCRLKKREPIVRKASWKNGKLVMVRKHRSRRSLAALGLLPRPRQQKAAESRMRPQKPATSRCQSDIQKKVLASAIESNPSKSPETAPQVNAKAEATGILSQRNKQTTAPKDNKLTTDLARKKAGQKRKEEEDSSAGKRTVRSAGACKGPQLQQENKKPKCIDTKDSLPLIKTLALQLINRVDSACNFRSERKTRQERSPGSPTSSSKSLPEAETVILDSCGVEVLPSHHLNQEKEKLDLSELEQAGIPLHQSVPLKPVKDEESCQTTKLSRPCQTSAYPDMYFLDAVTPRSSVDTSDKPSQTTSDIKLSPVEQLNQGASTSSNRAQGDPLSVINIYTRQRTENANVEHPSCTVAPGAASGSLECRQAGPSADPKPSADWPSTKASAEDPTKQKTSTQLTTDTNGGNNYIRLRPRKRDTIALWRKLSVEIERLKQIRKACESAKTITDPIIVPRNKASAKEKLAVSSDAECAASVSIREDDGSDSDVFTFHHARKRRKNRKTATLSQEVQKIDWLEKNVAERRKEAQQWRLKWKRHLLEAELKNLDAEICETRTRIERSSTRVQEPPTRYDSFLPEAEHVRHMKAFVDVPAELKQPSGFMPRSIKEGIDSVVDSTNYSDSFMSDREEPLHLEEKKSRLVEPQENKQPDSLTEDHKRFLERSQRRADSKFETALPSGTGLIVPEEAGKRCKDGQFNLRDRFKKELNAADRRLELEKIVADRSRRNFWECSSEDRDLVLSEELDCEPVPASEHGTALTVSSEDFLTEPVVRGERSLTSCLIVDDEDCGAVDRDADVLQTACSEGWRDQLKESVLATDGNELQVLVAVGSNIDKGRDERGETGTRIMEENTRICELDAATTQEERPDVDGRLDHQLPTSTGSFKEDVCRASPVPHAEPGLGPDSSIADGGKATIIEEEAVSTCQVTEPVNPGDLPGIANREMHQKVLEDEGELSFSSGYSDVDEFEDEVANQSSLNKEEQPPSIRHANGDRLTPCTIGTSGSLVEDSSCLEKPDGGTQKPEDTEDVLKRGCIDPQAQAMDHEAAEKGPLEPPKEEKEPKKSSSSLPVDSLDVEDDIPEEILVDDLCSSTEEEPELTSEELCYIRAAFGDKEGADCGGGNTGKLELGMEAARLVEDRLEHELENQKLADRRMTDVLFAAVLQNDFRGNMTDSFAPSVEADSRGLNKAKAGAPLTKKMSVTTRTLQKKHFPSRILPGTDYANISLKYILECVKAFVAFHNPQFGIVDEHMKQQQQQDLQHLSCFNRIIFDCISECVASSSTCSAEFCETSERKREQVAACVARKIMSYLPSSSARPPFRRVATFMDEEAWHESDEYDSIASELCELLLDDLIQELLR